MLVPMACEVQLRADVDRTITHVTLAHARLLLPPTAWLTACRQPATPASGVPAISCQVTFLYDIGTRL